METPTGWEIQCILCNGVRLVFMWIAWRAQGRVNELKTADDVFSLPGYRAWQGRGLGRGHGRSPKRLTRTTHIDVISPLSDACL